jgi:hypothetical protein
LTTTSPSGCAPPSAPPSASAARGRRLSLSRRSLAVLSHGGPLVSPRPPRSRGTCATSSTTSSRRSARLVPLAPPPGTAGGRARRCVRSWQRRLGTWLAPARRRSALGSWAVMFGSAPPPPSLLYKRNLSCALASGGRPFSAAAPLVSPRPPRSRGTCATSSTTSSRRSARLVPLAPPPGTAGGAPGGVCGVGSGGWARGWRRRGGDLRSGRGRSCSGRRPHHLAYCIREI